MGDYYHHPLEDIPEHKSTAENCTAQVVADFQCNIQSTLEDVTEHSHTPKEEVTAEFFPVPQTIYDYETPMDDNHHHPLEDILEHKPKPTAEKCTAQTVADVKPPLGIHTRPSMELGSSVIGVKRRRPCYGWISNDYIDEYDLVYLAPGPPQV